MQVAAAAAAIILVAVLAAIAALLWAKRRAVVLQLKASWLSLLAMVMQSQLALAVLAVQHHHRGTATRAAIRLLALSLQQVAAQAAETAASQPTHQMVVQVVAVQLTLAVAIQAVLELLAKAMLVAAALTVGLSLLAVAVALVQLVGTEAELRAATAATV